MKTMSKISLVLMLLGGMLLSGEGYAQSLKSGQEKKFVRKGRKAYRKGEYWKAKSYYDKVTQASSQNAQYWFEAGLVYYDSQVKREDAIIYFEKALDLTLGGTDTIPEIFYYAGKTYHFIGEFEKAIDTYNTFLKHVKNNKQGQELSKDVLRQIEVCNNGIDLRDVHGYEVEEIVNLGEKVNSEYPDFTPVIDANETILLFCSRRPPENTKGTDGLYYEDIYYTVKLVDGQWGEAQMINKSSGYIQKEINEGKAHEAPISLSADGRTLYIYKENSIWKSEKDDEGKWSVPKRMNQNVNIGYANPSIYITPDEQEMFIVSIGVDDSYGNRDIYHTTRNDLGGWNKPVNLGPKINTPFHDDAPYLSKDGKTLYFASQGHNSMGGFDIYRTRRGEDGEWGEPENIGTPVNSAGDDIFYVENEEGTLAYYSSMRPGSFGYLDLYTARYGCTNIESTTIKGYAIFADNNLPVNGVIKITDKETAEEMGTYVIDRNTGKYTMNLPPNKTYILEMVIAGSKYNDVRPHTEEFTIPKQCEAYNLFQQIKIDYLADSDGKEYAQRAHFKNAMFDIDTEIKEKYQVEDMDAAEYIVQLGSFDGETPAEFMQQIKASQSIKINSRTTENNTTEYFAGPYKTETEANSKSRALKKLNFENMAVKEVDGEEYAELFASKGISGNLTHDGTLIAKNVEVVLLNEYNQILRITQTDERGHFAFESLDASRDYILVINEDDAKASIGTGLEVGIMGTVNTFVGKQNTAMPEQKIYFADGNRKISNTTATDKNGNFNFTNKAENANEIAEMNDNITISYKLDVSNDEVVYSAYILTIDPDNTDLAYTEYIDIIELKDLVDGTDVTDGGTDPKDGGHSGAELQEFANLLFDFDKFFLRDKSKDILSSLYAYMDKNPSVTIRLDGHTDWIGTEEYNDVLSKNRSLSAHKYLIDRGIAPNRIQNKWFGELQPTAQNEKSPGVDDPDGRQLNRRVEIKVEIPEMSDIYISL